MSGFDLDHLEDEILRYKLTSSFAYFVEYFWNIIDPADYIDTKITRIIANHLEAVRERKIKRLIINIPPRASKTMLSSIMFPAWVHCINPKEKFLNYTYSDNLVRDAHNLYFKLINSPEYIRLFPFVNDPKGKSTITGNLNLMGGCREGLSTGSSITGKGASIIILDDVINLTKAYSSSYRKQAEAFFFRSLSTRFNDPKTSAMVVVMQRSHEDDLIQKILDRQGDQWQKLILPMEYETAHKCKTYIDGKLFFEDDRTEEGQLLIPERFDRQSVELLKTSLGSIDASAQLQQRPIPAGGSLIKKDSITIKDDIPIDYNKTMFVRFYDLASTALNNNNDPDFTASVLIALSDNQFYIMDVTRGRFDPIGVEGYIRNTIAADRPETRQIVEIEPGSSGKLSFNSMARNISNKLQGIPTRKNKMAYMRPFVIAIQNGSIILKKASWNENFINELCAFPHGAHDDMADAASKCFETFQTAKRRVISG